MKLLHCSVFFFLFDNKRLITVFPIVWVQRLSHHWALYFTVFCQPSYILAIIKSCWNFLSLSPLSFFSMVTNNTLVQVLFLLPLIITANSGWSSYLIFLTSNLSCDYYQVSILPRPLDILNKISMLTALMELLALGGIQIVIWMFIS